MNDKLFADWLASMLPPLRPVPVDRTADRPRFDDSFFDQEGWT